MRSRIVFVFMCSLLPALAIAKKPELFTARMAFKLTELKSNTSYYSFVKFQCINEKCSWDETTTIKCIGGKQKDPYLMFPEIDHFFTGKEGQIKVEGSKGSYHVTWKDGSGNFFLNLDCSTRTPITGCKVKSATGLITDATATISTRYDYIDPLKGTIDLPCN